MLLEDVAAGKLNVLRSGCRNAAHPGEGASKGEAQCKRRARDNAPGPAQAYVLPGKALVEVIQQQLLIHKVVVEIDQVRLAFGRGDAHGGAVVLELDANLLKRKLSISFDLAHGRGEKLGEDVIWI